MGYRGVRILQDNVLWKPPGTKAIGFHQDGSYADYLVPPEMVTCWIALHDTQAGAGPIEYVRGSNHWPRAPPVRSQFHAPGGLARGRRSAAPPGAELEIVPVVVKAGRRLLPPQPHVARSRPNTSGRPWRGMALVSHMLPVETPVPPENVDLIYSRYRRRGDLSMDESFFPVMWDETGGPHAVARRAARPGRLIQSPRRRDASTWSIAQAACGSRSSAARTTSRESRRSSWDLGDDVGASRSAVEHRDLAEELALRRVTRRVAHLVPPAPAPRGSRRDRRPARPDARSPRLRRTSAPPPTPGSAPAAPARARRRPWPA